jgi:hypothetical protein
MSEWPVSKIDYRSRVAVNGGSGLVRFGIGCALSEMVIVDFYVWAEAVGFP